MLSTGWQHCMHVEALGLLARRQHLGVGRVGRLPVRPAAVGPMRATRPLGHIATRWLHRPTARRPLLHAASLALDLHEGFATV